MNALTPDFAAFQRAYQAGENQILWRAETAELQTPVAAFLKLAIAQDNSFLLESVQDGDARGRYSAIGFDPDMVFRVQNDKAELRRAPHDDFTPLAAPPLDALRAVLVQSHIALPDGLPSVAAGLFGYMGYDMVRHMERLPDANPDMLHTPDSLFIRPRILLIFDSVTDTLNFVAPIYPHDDIDAEAAYRGGQARITAAKEKLAQKLPATKQQKHRLAAPKSNMSKQAYCDMVDKAKAYIRAGDIFQVVLSQRFHTPFPLPPFDLYRALRRVNPSPYLFYLRFAGFSIVGSSPEVLVGLAGETVNIRPVAGTRLRGKTAQEDEKIGLELLADEKERAEHLMLLDLGRNDVGRVCEIGSVKVNTAFGLQKTSHLIHIVSDVTGRIAPDCDRIDVLAAGFPPGTVSGAPKIRAMEIIDTLEQERRGIYAGSVGYFSANGDMDMCIALRTAIVKDDTLYVQAGGGIVHDSTPQGEYDETVNKAAALFRAAEAAIAEAKERGSC